MSDNTTVDKLFDLAIAAEKFNEELYRRLAVMFSHYPEAANFWRMYAEEEVQHAQLLEQIRGTASPEQLSAPADSQMLKKAQKILLYSVKSMLAGIKNLEDAYQLITEVETAESNAVFDFLIEHFSTDEHTRSFVRAQLREHINVAHRFPTQFKSAMIRQLVKEIKDEASK